MSKFLLLLGLLLNGTQGDLFESTPLTSTSPPWSSAEHPIKPGNLYGLTGKPYPTNVWWQNMVLNDGDLINVVNPYIVKTLSDGLHVGIPAVYDDANYVASAFHDNIIISSTEGAGGHVVTAYDELSVTVQWDSGLSAPIVRGMPYVTMFYDGKTPELTFEGAVLSPSGFVSGTRFEVTLNNNQKWIIYTSTEVKFGVSGSTLTALEPMSGSLRAAGMTEGTQYDVEALDSHADKIPVGGTISTEVEGDVADMRFNWITEGSGELLMMALRHHLDTLTNAQVGHTIQVLKGEMVGIPGDVWYFLEPLTTITWGAPRPVASSTENDIRSALAQDIANTPCCNDDPYFGGKQMAVYARLALIADELGETSLADQARQKVKPFIEGWLGGTNGNHLLYDQTWGGVISQNGLFDQQADFGNGMYNDHHFHYGYHIYTAAVLAKADPAWADKWNDALLHMISDVAEPSSASAYYPFARTKDFFDGHAWASGIFMFADGKNQESTSESVNGWYAIYLYGLATSNYRLMNLGRLMTALEIRAAWRYWQMTSAKSNFPAPFSNNKAVGIQWSSKVDYQTWFGANVEFIHCIQMLPFTPITEELLRGEWIAEEYNVLQEAYSRPDPPLSEGWKGYVIMAHAIIDPTAAYSEALGLTGYDDGNTKSNTLYWIATRGDGNFPTGPPGPTTTTSRTTTTNGGGPGGCDCGQTTIIDPGCLDPGTDQWGGLGCDACGVPDCRFCGFGVYSEIPCS